MELSPDPLLEELTPVMGTIKLGDDNRDQIADIVRPILNRSEIFAVDLYEAGLADKVVDYLVELTEKPGAVRDTLNRALN
jgi:fructuronate reductase